MRRGKARFLSHLVVGTALGLFGSWQASAQGVPEPATPTPPATTSAVNDIIVTAQRRSERLVDVPMSITAVNSTALAKAGVATFTDLDQVVVGVKIGNTGIFPEPSVRGITSFLTAGGADSNVAVYVDGFYQADPLLFAQDFVNLQGIEVLKGPQGSLYGRNASGGAILIHTLDPDMNKFTGKFSAGYGNYNDARGSGYVSIPLAPGLALSASGSYRRNDGFIRGITIGTHNNHYYNAAPYRASQFQTKLKWEPTDNLSMTLGYHYTYLSDPNANSYNITHNKLPALRDPSILQTDRRDHIIRNVQTIFKSRSDTVQFKLQWKSDIGTLTAQTQWQRTSSDTYQDDDDTALDYTRNGARFGKKGFDNNLEFHTNAIDHLDLVMGVNYFADKSTGDGLSYKGTLAQCAPSPVAPCVSGSKSWMKTRAFAPYIDGTYNIADKLFLTAGVRYTSEKKITTAYLFSGADLFGLGSRFPLRPLIVGGTNGGFIHKKTFKDLTPRAVLRYEFSRGANVYASFSKGFKSGTFNTSINPLSPINPPVKPEKATNYEIGFKVARPRFRVEGAVFYTKYTNLQTSAVVQGGPPNFSLTTVVLNAKGAENYGGELNAAWTPVDDLNIHGGVGYTHARYLKFPKASVNLLDRRQFLNNTTTCPVGTTPCVPNPNYLIANQTNTFEDFSGLQIERAPDWTANFGVDYTAHIGGGSLVLSTNASYVSSYYPRTAAYDPITKKPLHRQKGYAIVNAQATYNFAGDNFSIGAWIKNITDKRFKTADVDSTNGSYTLYSWPRTFGFNVGYRF